MLLPVFSFLKEAKGSAKQFFRGILEFRVLS